MSRLVTYVQQDLEVLDSLRLPSGLTIAATDPSYEKVWIRDNCYVGLAYWHAGKHEIAVKLFEELLKIIDRYSWKIDWILWEGKPSATYKRLHPRYDINGFEIPEPWGFIQNDSFGLLLWCVGWLADRGAKIVSDQQVHLIQKLVWYLSAIRYWEDPDNGMWEQNDVLHASSIGCCLAGLRMHQSRVMVPDEAIHQGERVLAELGNRESYEHGADLAQLALVWPLGLRGEEIVAQAEKELLRRKGTIRYQGDPYNRGAAEAEWPMGLAWLGLCRLALGDTEKAWRYLDTTNRLRLKGLLPESFVPKRRKGQLTYAVCEHHPLVWSHALALILAEMLNAQEEREREIEEKSRDADDASDEILTSAISDEPELASAISDEPELASAISDEPELASAISDEPEPASAVSDEPEPASAISNEPEPASAISDEPEPASAISDESELASAVSDESELASAVSEDASGERAESILEPLPTLIDPGDDSSTRAETA